MGEKLKLKFLKWSRPNLGAHNVIVIEFNKLYVSNTFLFMIAHHMGMFKNLSYLVIY